MLWVAGPLSPCGLPHQPASALKTASKEKQKKHQQSSQVSPTPSTSSDSLHHHGRLPGLLAYRQPRCSRFCTSASVNAERVCTGIGWRWSEMFASQKLVLVFLTLAHAHTSLCSSPFSVEQSLVRLGALTTTGILAGAALRSFIRKCCSADPLHIATVGRLVLLLFSVFRFCVFRKLSAHRPQRKKKEGFIRVSSLAVTQQPVLALFFNLTPLPLPCGWSSAANIPPIFDDSAPQQSAVWLSGAALTTGPRPRNGRYQSHTRGMSPPSFAKRSLRFAGARDAHDSFSITVCLLSFWLHLPYWCSARRATTTQRPCAMTDLLSRSVQTRAAHRFACQQLTEGFFVVAASSAETSYQRVGNHHGPRHGYIKIQLQPRRRRPYQWYISHDFGRPILCLSSGIFNFSPLFFFSQFIANTSRRESLTPLQALQGLDATSDGGYSAVSQSLAPPPMRALFTIDGNSTILTANEVALTLLKGKVCS